MRKLAVLVAVAAVSLVVSTGCGKSKITQCNALIDSANKSQAGFEHIDPDKPEKMKEAIGKIKKGNQDVAATQVEDAKLKTLRDDYVKTHESIATTLQKREEIAEKLEKAEKGNDQKAIASLTKDSDALEKTMDKDLKDSDKVIEDINTYCHAL